MRVTETISRLCPSSVCADHAPASTDVWRGLAGDAVPGDALPPVARRGRADDPVTGFAELTPPDEADEPVFADLDISQPDRFRSLIDGLDGDEPRPPLPPHPPAARARTGTCRPATSTTARSRTSAGSSRLDQWGDEAWPVTLGRQRHLLQLGYVDRLIGVLLDELEAQGLYDDALVVVTADHGISFEPGGPIRAIEGQALDEHSTPDILWVPFFVKEPGQTEGDVSDANVLSIDVLPTIADVLDVDLPFRGRRPVGARAAAVRPPTSRTTPTTSPRSASASPTR